MSPSLFDDPHRPPPPAAEGVTAPPSSPPEHRASSAAGAPPAHPSGRNRLAVAVVVSSLLGGAAASALLVTTGIVGGSAPATTTVVESAPGAVRAISSRGGGLDAADLYERNAAGVVDITASGTSTVDDGSPFDFGQQEQQRSTATGTGFVIDGAGNILTAAHVINDASDITVAFQDGTRRSAKLISRDEATDVALLKVDPSGVKLHPLTLGSSAALRAGDPLAAIGDPFGYERSISTGVVSGLDRTIDAPNGFTVAHAIQTDAPLNPGNSGGPVLDAAGRVVGIADQIATGGASANAGVGFLVPIDLVKSELADLKAGRTVRHAYLGVSTSSVVDGSDSGAIAQRITPGGPAEAGGLRAGDVVTAIDGSKVADSNGLISVIAGHRPGDRVALTVRRGGDDRTVHVTLGAQPTSVRQQSTFG